MHIIEFSKYRNFSSDISLEGNCTLDALIFRTFKENICGGVSFQYSNPGFTPDFFCSLSCKLIPQRKGRCYEKQLLKFGKFPGKRL